MAPLGWAEHGRLPPFPGPEPGFFVPVDYSPDYSFPQPKNPENGFIYPFVPDSPYLPDHWKDVKQGLRHPKGWTRRFDLQGPYLKDLTGVEIEELPPYPTCEAMMEAFKTYGRNGACERISTQDFHALGQIFTRQVMDDCEKQSASECYDNLKLYFRDTMYMAFEGQKISFDTPRPTRIGQLHGSQVMFLGNAAYNNYTANASWVPDWDFIIDVICAGTPESAYHHFHFCMHGVGHAFGYLTIFFPISKTDYHCMPDPIPQIKDGHRAFLGARLCNTAPYSSLARLCNFGIWHGLLEYTVGEYVVTDGVTHYNYMYPCNALPEYSAHCYGQLFAYMGRGDWRWDNIKNISMAPGGLIKMCTDNPTLVNERNVQGCIFGLAAVWFLLYDKVTTARSVADLRIPPHRDACEKPRWGATDFNAYDLTIWDSPEADYFDALTYMPPVEHCKLFWNSGILPTTHIRHTLSSFCELFVSPSHAEPNHILSPTDWGRWKACVAGSFDLSATMSFMALVIPYGAYRQRWCPQMLEVPWLNTTFRAESYHLCLNFSSPPLGGQREWGADLGPV